MKDWEDTEDEWTKAIDAAHPIRTGVHKHYETALMMVGHRHGKGALVELVNWLLVERAAYRAALKDVVSIADDGAWCSVDVKARGGIARIRALLAGKDIVP